MDYFSEFLKQYEQSFIRIFKPDGTKEIIWISSGADKFKETLLCVPIANGKFGLQREISIHNEKLDLSFPDIGYTNYKDTVFLVKRIPERQWTKGFCRKVIQIENVLSDSSVKKPPPDASDFVEEVFSSNVPFDLQEFLANPDRLGRAVTKKLAITKHKGTILLHFNGATVGYVDNDKAILPKWAKSISFYISKFFPCEVE